ncbi:MAG: precorrin-8X methylmutase [Firmicutes bacterium]|nr:precorrin-8X methylmutase [Bacillota bacterium]
MDFLTDPRVIEARSMEIIDGLLGGTTWPEKERSIIKRIVHTTGDAGYARLVEVHPRAIDAALSALGAGKKIIADVQMVKAGISPRKVAELGSEVVCAIDEPVVVREAEKTGLTRAMLAIRRLAGAISGNIVVIGNAPTALFELMRLIEEARKAGQPEPAVVIATPVGFVGAEEAKRLLAQMDLPYITVHGTRGGSTIAACIINALLYML